MSQDYEHLESLIREEILRCLVGGETKREILVVMPFLPLDKDFLDSLGLEAIFERFSSTILSPDPSYPLPAPLSEIPPYSPDKAREQPGRDHIRALVILNPSLSLLAQTALGIADQPCSRLLLGNLLDRKPVLTIHDPSCDFPPPEMKGPPVAPASSGLSFDSHPPHSPRNLYQQYYKTLEEWGMRQVSPSRLFQTLETLLNPAPDSTGSSPARENSVRRMIVTGDDILDKLALGGKEWVIPENAIVTSIAQETAQRNGFSLIRKKP